MIPVEQIDCYILAGGQSKRMGRDKGLLAFGQESFVGHIREQAFSLFPEVTVIAANPAYQKYAPCMPDLIPGKGPLGGLFTALHKSPHRLVLLLSCDMPLIDAGLLRHFLKHCSPGAICLARSGGRIHPFPGLYPPQVLGAVKKMLDEEHLKIMDLQGPSQPCIIDLEPFAGQMSNINTPEDYQKLNKH